MCNQWIKYEKRFGLHLLNVIEIMIILFFQEKYNHILTIVLDLFLVFIKSFTPFYISNAELYNQIFL